MCACLPAKRHAGVFRRGEEREGELVNGMGAVDGAGACPSGCSIAVSAVVVATVNVSGGVAPPVLLCSLPVTGKDVTPIFKLL